MKYTNAEVKGLNQNTLRLYWYDATRKMWIKVSGGVNTTSKDVYAYVNHLSIYGISGAVIPPVYTPSPTYTPKVTLLANNIDLGLAGTLVSYLKAQGIKVDIVNATNFSEYNKHQYIIILGGQQAYDGIGNIVKKFATIREQNMILQSITYIKTGSVFRTGGETYLFAGKDRYTTQKAWEEHYKEVAKEIRENWG